LRYVDIKHGQRRAVRLHRPEGHSDRATLEAFLLAGDTRAQAWIKTLLQDELPAQAYGRQLLWASEQPPAALSQLSPRSPQICTCFNVSQTQIEAELTHATGSEGERLAHLQTTLKCGTNCGSCIPQLKQLIRVHPVAA
jgi:assimilatory nitrate reductase catalytic subunit